MLRKKIFIFQHNEHGTRVDIFLTKITHADRRAMRITYIGFQEITSSFVLRGVPIRYKWRA